MARPGSRRPREDGGPLHRPKRARPHVADEYAELGQRLTAAELRRHLRGGMRAFIDAANVARRG